MLKKSKKAISIILAVVMLASVIIAVPTTASAATSAIKTQSEAVAWLNAQGGASYNLDPSTSGTQCVEFVKAYVNWLLKGNAWTDAWGRGTGNGIDVWRNSLWSELGWQVYTNTLDFMPQPGDIFSSGTSGYGHTGVVISSDLNTAKVADANVDSPYNGTPVKVHNITWKTANSNAAYGATHFIRPIFKSPHTHNYSTLSGYESSHPHYAIYKCSCGATQVNRNITSYLDSCSECLSGLGATQTISDGDYHIISALDKSFGLNVAYDSKDSGANVQLWNNMDDANTSSLITVKHLGNGYYSLTFKNSGKALDVCNAGTASGTNVQQYNPNTSNAQQWVIKDAGDGYYFYIISKRNGLYLDAQGGVAAGATNIQVYNRNGSNAQKWRFVASGLSSGETVKNGKYYITSALKENLSLDFPSTANGSNVYVANKALEDMESFDIEYIGNGYYRINSTKVDRRIDVTDNNPYKGANVQIYDSNEWNAQKWIIKPTGDGYYNIIAMYSGLYLDVTNSGTSDKTNVCVWVGNGGANQKWKIQSVESVKPEPTTEQAEPITEPSEPKTDPTQLTVETTQPVTETTETTAPISTEPSETTEPISTEPTADISEPTAKPSDQTTEPTELSPVTSEKTDISDWTVIGLANAAYTGKEVTQIVAVTDGTDYATFDVSYKNNVKAGNATIIIKGTGDYTGTIVETFKITKAKQPMTVKAKTKSVSVSKLRWANQNIKNAITVKKNKGKITYAKVAKGSSKYLKISKKGVITFARGWYYKGTYKIKVKVTASGNSNYKKGSKTVTVKIKVK